MKISHSDGGTHGVVGGLTKSSAVARIRVIRCGFIDYGLRSLLNLEVVRSRLKRLEIEEVARV